VVRQVLLRNLLSELDGLTPQQEAYVRHRASIDFVVYNRVSNRPGEPPRFRIPDPIRSGPEGRTIYARTAQEVHT
jgi:hypothetical protein